MACCDMAQPAVYATAGGSSPQRHLAAGVAGRPIMLVAWRSRQPRRGRYAAKKSFADAGSKCGNPDGRSFQEALDASALLIVY